MRALRTTIVLGNTAHAAAKRLAVLWGVTQAEAIRRAVIRVDQEAFGSAREALKRSRTAALDSARDVVGSVDLDVEMRRVKKERDGW